MYKKTALFISVIILNSYNVLACALSACDVPLQRAASLSWQLLEAAESADIQSMTSLINAGADVNFETEWDQPHCGQPVLGFAIKSKSAKAVKLLLDAGANPNRWMEAGFLKIRIHSLLSYAIGIHAPIEIVRDLITAGADVNRKTLIFGKVGPLDVAKAFYYPEAVELLLKAGAK
jgi:hypothetical protein